MVSIRCLFSPYICLSFLYFACSQDKKEDNLAVEDDTDNFAQDTSVLISSPTNGAIVEDSFFLQYTAGVDVATLELQIDDQFSTNLDISAHETLIHLDIGAHKLGLIGLDTEGNWLSAHEITVTVPTDNWITIVSPTHGSVVTNPVRFTVNSSNSIDSYEITADDWSLGTANVDDILTYSFSGTGYLRHIKAIGYSNGDAVAEHNIDITVDAGTEPLQSDFNDIVLNIIDTYPIDGSHGYYWPSSGGWLGTTQDIWYQGTLIAEGDSSNRSYCVGLTFETFMRSWEIADIESSGDGTINGMTVSDVQNFRIDWYVRDLLGAGPADAVENYGIGELVTDWDDVQAGDFLQFWRNSGSGHNVIFIDWEYDTNNNRIGFLYWSTQSSTDGIGYNSEYFGSTGSSVDAQYFFPARVYMPDNWISWQ